MSEESASECLRFATLVAAAFVFVRWAPFGRRERPLFALGY